MLILDEKAHVYYWDGQRVPGLSEILKSVGLNREWYSPEKSRLGSYVHKAIHLLNRGTLNWDTVKPPILGYVRAYQKAQNALKFRVILSEVSLYVPKYGYACTPDGLIEIEGLGAPLELKSGQITSVHALQVGAQIIALEENGYSISKRHILKLYEDEIFKLEPIDFRAKFDWLQVLSFYHLKQKYLGG